MLPISRPIVAQGAEQPFDPPDWAFEFRRLPQSVRWGSPVMVCRIEYQGRNID
jgi:hypothetical protein